jgi:hypothetical protein
MVLKEVGATFLGEPGANTSTNFTPDEKYLSIENSTWYMINSTGSLSKIHFGVQDHGMVPYTRLLNGNIHRGLPGSNIKPVFWLM